MRRAIMKAKSKGQEANGLRIADCGLRIGESILQSAIRWQQSVIEARHSATEFRNPQSAIRNPQSASGFSLVELMVAMTVFLIIGGAVALLLSKSQTIFRAE